MGLLHTVQHGLLIPGRQGDQVDDFGLNALLGQQVRSAAGILHADGVGHDGHILPLTLHAGLAQGVRLLLADLGHFAFLLVQDLVLEVQHGVIALDGGLQHHLGVIGIGGRHNLDAGDVGEPGLHALGMLCSAAAGRTVGRTQDQGHLGLAAEHVADLCHLVEDLVHGHADEVGEVHVHHGTGAGQSRAYAAADDKGLGNGGINDPAGELLGQALELTEDTALTGQVLAHCEYSGVFRHRLGHGLLSGLRKSDLTHRICPPSP